MRVDCGSNPGPDPWGGVLGPGQSTVNGGLDSSGGCNVAGRPNSLDLGSIPSCASRSLQLQMTNAVRQLDHREIDTEEIRSSSTGFIRSVTRIQSKPSLIPATEL